MYTSRRHSNKPPSIALGLRELHPWLAPIVAAGICRGPATLTAEAAREIVTA